MPKSLRRTALAAIAFSLTALSSGGLAVSTPAPPARPPVIYYGAGLATVCRPVGKATAVLFIHGGGWTRGSRNDGILIPCMSMPDTVSAISIDYRLAPQNKWPSQLDDAKAAVAYLRSHGATRVCAWGQSAGGHIAAWLAVLGVVDCAVGESMPTLASPALLPAGKTVNDLNPALRVTSSSAPLYLMHGTRDNVVPLSQARAMEQAYRAAGRPVTLIVYDGKHVGGRVPRAKMRAMRMAATRFAVP